MKIWQYLVAGLVVALGSGLCPIAHGQNVNIILDEADDPDTTSPRRQQPEPTIAIDPLNSDFLAGGAQDFRRTTELREACGGDRWNGFQTRPMDLDIQARHLPSEPETGKNAKGSRSGGRHAMPRLLLAKNLRDATIFSDEGLT